MPNPTPEDVRELAIQVVGSTNDTMFHRRMVEEGVMRDRSARAASTRPAPAEPMLLQGGLPTPPPAREAGLRERVRSALNMIYYPVSTAIDASGIGLRPAKDIAYAVTQLLEALSSPQSSATPTDTAQEEEGPSREQLMKVFVHARGLAFGADWNNGTAAGFHRNKLIDALVAIQPDLEQVVSRRIVSTEGLRNG